jgi:hypothetical protein
MQIVKNESEEMAITIPMDKFPRLQSLQKIVADLHNLVEYFNKRKSLIKNNIDEVTPYQNNENKILVIQTDIELARLHTTIYEKEKQIKDYMENEMKSLNECDEEFETLMNKAREVAKNDTLLDGVLKETNFDFFKENYEHKLNHYLAIKKYLTPKDKTAEDKNPSQRFVKKLITDLKTLTEQLSKGGR